MALTQEDLQAIGALMDTKLEPLQEEQAKTNARLDKIEKGQSAMQKDITHIKKKVDIAYNWVDGIDLRVKALEHG